MNVRLVLPFLACLVFTVLPTSCKQQEHVPAVPGNPAPPFKLVDVNGAPVRLSDFAGSVVVLDFWATWCGPCREATAELEQLHRQYADRKVVVVGISVNKEADAAERIKSFAKVHGLTYRLVKDDGSAYRAYGITIVPATFILDRNHIIRVTYPGFQPGIAKQMAMEIDKLL
ncbi:MAG: TlpA disulfide reductase family protein [Nitrospiraceae bacterium]|nr:TlpA disulfide reductase family protein [Nitrospiraceae bacterium]